MCFQTCDLIAYCRVFYAAPEHCSNLCLNKCNNGSQVPTAFAIFALSTHPFKRHNLKSVSSIFILHQRTPGSDLLRFKAKTRFLCWMLSLASKTQAVFFLPCTSPCQPSRCWSQPLTGNFAGGAGRGKKKKIAFWSTQILLSENWICIKANFFFFCNGQTPMFLEMLQDVAGAVEERVGPWTRDRLWRQQWVVPQHPLADVALLFKSRQRNTSFSV